MPYIKLPKDNWGKAWRLLIQEGGTTRTSKDHIYLVSNRFFPVNPPLHGMFG